MELERLKVLDVQIAQLNNHLGLIKRFQGWTVVLILLYGVLVSSGYMGFKGYLFGSLVALAIGLFMFSFVVARKISIKFRDR